MFLIICDFILVNSASVFLSNAFLVRSLEYAQKIVMTTIM